MRLPSPYTFALLSMYCRPLLGDWETCPVVSGVFFFLHAIFTKGLDCWWKLLFQIDRLPMLITISYN